MMFVGRTVRAWSPTHQQLLVSLCLSATYCHCLYSCQKRPISMSEEAYINVKRGLYSHANRSWSLSVSLPLPLPLSLSLSLYSPNLTHIHTHARAQHAFLSNVLLPPITHHNSVKRCLYQCQKRPKFTHATCVLI